MLRSPLLLALVSANLLIVVLSCLGWGKALSRWVCPCPDNGLRIGWGLALILAIGGWLVALDLSFPLALCATLAVGLIALVTVREKHQARPIPWILPVALACLGANLVAGVLAGWNNACDDQLAYFPLIEELRATGGMEAPFSIRRLAAYGGQNFLQELTTLPGGWLSYRALEFGLSPLVIFGLMFGEMAKRRLHASSFVVIAYVLTISFGSYINRANSASEATTVIFVLTLLRTLKLTEDGIAPRRLLIMAGIVAAGLSTLRDSNLAYPAILFALLAPTRHQLSDWRSQLRDGLTFGMSWIAGLLPWAIALQESSGTPLYPLIGGFHHRDFETYTIGGGLAVWLSHAWGVIALMPVSLVVAAGSAALSRSRLPMLGLSAALLGAAIIIVVFASADAPPLSRYIYPSILAATLFAVAVVLCERLTLSPIGEKSVHALGVAAMVLQLSSLLLNPPAESKSEPAYEARIGIYRLAQAAVPPGEKILVFVSGPFGFDMARNPIVNLDLPGPVSPPPGMPFFKGPEALAQYLRTLGINYVIYEDFDTAINLCVARPEWTRWATGGEVLLEKYSPYGLDAMGNLEAFGVSGKILFQDNGVTAVAPAQ